MQKAWEERKRAEKRDGDVDRRFGSRSGGKEPRMNAHHRLHIIHKLCQHNHPGRRVQPPFKRQEKRGSKTSSDLPRVPQLDGDKVGLEPGPPGSEALQCGGGTVQVGKERKDARGGRVV